MNNVAFGFAEKEVAKIAGSIDKQDKRCGYFIIKRAFDIISSAAALIILSPIFLILAIIIFCDDHHGSPIFSQIRVGRHGKEFKFYKFRSMIVNAEQLIDQLQEKNEMQGNAFKIKDDPRVTRIGKFIRKTSLDELPQLWNVLKGDMSIVGPRPPLPREVANYSDYEKLRLMVTPGLTCYWQTAKRRNDMTFDEWVISDIQYIHDRSLWVDIKLIFKTVCVMFTGEGM